MTYPKEKLTPGVDAPGVYLCEFKLRAHSLREIWWDGRDYWWDSGHNIQAVPEVNFTNFLPVAPAPEVVEGETYHTLPRGNWIVLGVDGRLYLVRDDDNRQIQRGNRALRIPDAWLAALTKPKSEPVVTERHREAARDAVNTMTDKGADIFDVEACMDYIAEAVARHFPVEAAK